MLDTIFTLAALLSPLILLVSPLILLALAAGIAGPVVKIKIRFVLLGIVVVGSTMLHVLWEFFFKRTTDKTDTHA